MPFLFFLPLCNHGRSKLSAENTNGIIPPSARRLAATSLYKGGKKVVISHLSVNKGRCFFLQKNVKNGKKGAIY